MQFYKFPETFCLFWVLQAVFRLRQMIKEIQMQEKMNYSS